MFWTTKPTPLARLYDQSDFYPAFARDVRRARNRVIIESPFIARWRFYDVLPVLEHAAHRGVRVIVNTRDPAEHLPAMHLQADECIAALFSIGAEVLYTGRLHRKIAIVDDTVWDGSLNILSQSDSLEIMRRTESAEYAQRLIKLTKTTRWYN